MKSYKPSIEVESYINTLKQQYGQYVKFENIKGITEDIYLISENERIGCHSDMQKHRGKCDKKTGNIYFKDDIIILDSLFVHEYIHRITRKKYWVNKWILGIAYNYKTVYFNEVLTEWYSYKVTGIMELENIYTFAFPIIEKLNDKYEKEMEESYFKNNLKLLKRTLSKNYIKTNEAISNIVYYAQCGYISKVNQIIKNFDI